MFVIIYRTITGNRYIFRLCTHLTSKHKTSNSGVNEVKKLLEIIIDEYRHDEIVPERAKVH